MGVGPTGARTQPLALLLVPLALLAASPTSGCNNMVLRNIKTRACSSSSALKNFQLQATLTKECTVQFKACFNATRMLNTTKISYKVSKPFFSTSGAVDWCQTANQLCDEEEKRVGVSCAASRSGAGGKQRKSNKFASVQCPLRKGYRCIPHVVDVKELKSLPRTLVKGTVQVVATVEHGGAGASCFNGSFVVADAAAKAG